MGVLLNLFALLVDSSDFELLKCLEFGFSYFIMYVKFLIFQVLGILHVLPLYYIL